MKNQNNCTRRKVTNGDSSRRLERSSDSFTLRSALLSLLKLSSQQCSFKKPALQLITCQLAGKVPPLQQKTEAGIRTPEFLINARARNQGVFFCAILSMVAQAGHLLGGRNLMGPVVLTPFGLPPLRLEPHAVATLTHQRLPA